MKRLLLLLVWLLPILAAGQRRFRLVEWNVENLFDTLHTEGHADAEFLPGSERHWTGRRYWRKLGRVSRALAAASGLSPADLIILCEVETDSVIRDLTRRTALAKLGYERLITDCRDPRGLNVAVLYQPLSFRPVAVRTVSVPYNPRREKPTRDVLLVSGRLPTGDTLDVAAVHFPSRAGGQTATSKYRQRAAGVVRSLADSLRGVRQNFLFVMAGDCNDEAGDRSLRRALDAVPASGEPDKEALYLLPPEPTADGVRGTYKFQGEWNELDHVVVSGAVLMSESPFRLFGRGCRIFGPEFLLERDGAGVLRPRRTYLGTHYHGGLSDHLPLVADFEF